MLNKRELNEEVKRKYYLDFYTLRAKIYITLPEFEETYGHQIKKLIKEELNQYTGIEIKLEKERLSRRLEKTSKRLQKMRENYLASNSLEISFEASKDSMDEDELGFSQK